MKHLSLISIVFLFCTFFTSPTTAETNGPALEQKDSTRWGQLGVSYGQEFRVNKNISQVELFWRQKLPYAGSGDNWTITTAIELAGALLDEKGSDNSSTSRFSLMPQVHFTTGKIANFIAGIGAGYMSGETDFSGHDLGGPFLLSAKLAFQLFLGKRFSLEYCYYHQSNASIYEDNYGLNMHQVALTIRL